MATGEVNNLCLEPKELRRQPSVRAGPVKSSDAWVVVHELNGNAGVNEAEKIDRSEMAEEVELR
jgi:hypothetical protein